MILYFRLLAGLMSLVWNLCFSHFDASGPDGTLELSVAMLFRLLSSIDCSRRHRSVLSNRGREFGRGARTHVRGYGRGLDLKPLLLGVFGSDHAHEDRHRHHRIADENRDAPNFGEGLDARPPDMVPKPERLEHARDSVAEVH